jgi:hypothetical protein
LGSTPHPSGCDRRVARGRLMPSGVGSRRRAGPPEVRGQPRKDGVHELEPRRPLRGRAPDCEVSLRGRDAVGIGNQSPSGDLGPMRGLPSGGSTCVRAAFRGGWDAAEAPPSGGAGATMRSIPAEPFGDPQGRWRNAAAFGLQAPTPAADDLRVARPASTPEPDKAETLCLPLDVRVVGTPRGFTRGRNAQLVWAARKRAAASERVDPKPMGASSGAQRKRRVAATSSPVEQSPEVGAGAKRIVATRERSRSERREGTPAGEGNHSEGLPQGSSTRTVP